jgi:four helix bundle protein
MTKPKTGDHRDLEVWQLAMDLTLQCYMVTRALPDRERFGLISQLQRAAVSVAVNIAEGYGRATPREMLRFMSMSRGSLREVETVLELIKRLSYATREQVAPSQLLAVRVSKALWGLRKAKLRKIAPPDA